jgi:hypothetical protein
MERHHIRRSQTRKEILMLKNFLVSTAALMPTYAMAAYGPWRAPEIDGGAAILGLAILGGILSFMKRKVP